MRMAKPKILLVLIIFASQSYLQTLFAQTAEKSILINDKNVELKECQKIEHLKSIALPIQHMDSVSIEMYLLSGPMPKGCMFFNSVEEFNAFDIQHWLVLEKNPDASSTTHSGADCASKPKLPARGGDRLAILVLKGSTELKNYVLPLCK